MVRELKFNSNSTEKQKATKKKFTLEYLRSLSERQVWCYYISLKESNKKGKLNHTRKAVRQYLFFFYKKDVISIADRYWYNNIPENSLVDADDLRQSALQKHLQCIDIYNPYYGDNELTYMKYINSNEKSLIIGSIIDCLRSYQDFPRSVSVNRRLMKDLIIALKHKIKRNPTVEDICEEYGEEYKEIVSDPLFHKNVFNQLSNVNSNSYDGNETEDSFEYYFSQIIKDSDKTKSIQDACESRDKFLSLLPEPEMRDAVFYYYFAGCTNEQVASIMGYSNSWVAIIRKRSVEYIREKYTSKEIRKIFYEQ